MWNGSKFHYLGATTPSPVPCEPALCPRHIQGVGQLIWATRKGECKCSNSERWFGARPCNNLKTDKRIFKMSCGELNRHSRPLLIWMNVIDICNWFKKFNNLLPFLGCFGDFNTELFWWSAYVNNYCQHFLIGWLNFSWWLDRNVVIY